jgi:hypothetical protein
MHARRLCFLVPPALFAATIAMGAVYWDFDHHVNFSRYHTYSWIGIQTGNNIWQDRIASAVECQLAAKGWKRVKSGGDAAVSAIGKVTQRDTLLTYFDGFPGWGWGWGPGWGGGPGWGWGWGGPWGGTAITRVVPEQVGDLTVNVFDGATRRLIWQGRAEKTLSSKPAKNDKKVEHAVEDMFEHFPPRPKG